MTARSGRLSTLAAALVIARRDFVAILFSRSFIFFLIGPLFPVLVGALAGGIGQTVQESAARPVLGVVLVPSEAAALFAARERLARSGLEGSLPELINMPPAFARKELPPTEALRGQNANLAAVVTGTLAAPVLTGPAERIEHWQGPVALLAAHALGNAPERLPAVALSSTASSTADQHRGQVSTGQAAQVLLFLLTMMLAGMVLSTLVEEKGNKIIEVLAAAIPMEAVFLGKLFAMLAVSLVGIGTWGLVLITVRLAKGTALLDVAAPAVGWPMFFLLGVVFFSLAYLLLGSLFLAIGSMASTVREVQTLSMPVTMMQLLTFFFASYAMAKPGSAVEMAAMILPFSSPFAMLARAAVDPSLTLQLIAMAWQVLCVFLFVRWGALLFRRRVMKSGPASGKRQRRGLFARKRIAEPASA